eukprot:Tbor_TRINITY_DN3819_c0_g1::TRINITY_DN3819_c0_g1_i1::g.5550::m.5550
MGIPELSKFLAGAPGALLRVSHTKGQPIEYDYVLIDGTNVSQTVGFEPVIQLLSKQITISKSIFIFFDSQRTRIGTSREQKIILTTHTSDVSAQRLSNDLFAQLGETAPPIYVSGRDVAGEADYKLLNAHRCLVMEAHRKHVESPKFLFISEDSDILCGALCGPSSPMITVATRLHDTTKELCLLSTKRILSLVSPFVEEPAIEEQQQTEPDFISRHKKQGPLRGQGSVVYFSDDNDDVTPAKKSVNCVTNAERDALKRSYTGILDFVLLFVIVKGSGVVPPAVTGVTKIDIQTVWNSAMSAVEDLTRLVPDGIELNGPVILEILNRSHMSDAACRPSSDEELVGAKQYLTTVVRMIFRYCISMRSSDSSVDLLDTREDPITEKPSFAALSAVLAQETLIFRFSEIFSYQKKMAKPPKSVDRMRSIRRSQYGSTLGEEVHPEGIVATKESDAMCRKPFDEIIQYWLEISSRSILKFREGMTPVDNSGASFSFELRRMTSCNAPNSKVNSLVLGAAGLSTFYGVENNSSLNNRIEHSTQRNKTEVPKRGGKTSRGETTDINTPISTKKRRLGKKERSKLEFAKKA